MAKCIDIAWFSIHLKEASNTQFSVDLMEIAVHKRRQGILELGAVLRLSGREVVYKNSYRRTWGSAKLFEFKTTPQR